MLSFEISYYMDMDIQTVSGSSLVNNSDSYMKIYM